MEKLDDKFSDSYISKGRKTSEYAAEMKSVLMKIGKPEVLSATVGFINVLAESSCFPSLFAVLSSLINTSHLSSHTYERKEYLFPYAPQINSHMIVMHDTAQSTRSSLKKLIKKCERSLIIKNFVITINYKFSIL